MNNYLYNAVVRLDKKNTFIKKNIKKNIVRNLGWSVRKWPKRHLLSLFGKKLDKTPSFTH